MKRRPSDIIAYGYIFFLLAVYPLIMKDGYSGLSDEKYRWFSLVSSVVLPVLAVMVIFRDIDSRVRGTQAAAGHSGTGRTAGRKVSGPAADRKLSGSAAGGTQAAVRCRTARTVIYFCAAYLLTVIISAAMCPYEDVMWNGTDAWRMGLASQLIFVGLTVVMYFWSRGCGAEIHGASAVMTAVMAAAVMAVTSFIMIIGIIQSFGVDCFHWWQISRMTAQSGFYSTIGQSSWYSGFLVLLCPAAYAGCVLEYRRCREAGKSSGNITEKAGASVGKGGTTEMSAGNFAGAALRMAAAGLYAILVTAALIFLGAEAGYAAIAVSMAGTAVICLETGGKPASRTVGKAVAAVVLLAAASAVAFMIFNSMRPEESAWHGLGGLLYFDDSWGSNRGLIWRHSLAAFRNLTLREKLFGIGPDCYVYAAYSIDTSDLQHLFGAMIQCAHNEWLNTLICYGIFGAAAYMGIFISAAVMCILCGRKLLKKTEQAGDRSGAAFAGRYAEQTEDRSNAAFAGRYADPAGGSSGMPDRDRAVLWYAAALTIIIYMLHGTTGYQQFVSTPVVFVLMGIASGCAER